MAGIYIHIPYCRQACHYCDFHFSTSDQTKSRFIEAMLKEAALQKNYAGGESVATIYFGGGTPSLLGEDELQRILDTMYHLFPVASDAEITLEANPDDLTAQKVKALRHAPINRFSIGVQSFFDEDLRWMNRVHDASQAEAAVKRVQDAGFENITLDLMYGLPLAAAGTWMANLEKAFSLQVPHLSCYSLTVEPRTALAHLISTGKSKPLNEVQATEEFEWLMKRMQQQGWLHYEISSFAAEEKFISKHNTSYWQGQKYIGLGPSAHSFDGTTRQWNVSNNRQYIESLSLGKIPFEKETLTPVQRINERIMTELRTMWGLDVTVLQQDYASTGMDVAGWLEKQGAPFFSDQSLMKKENTWVLTAKGKLLTDRIILHLMLDA